MEQTVLLRWNQVLAFGVGISALRPVALVLSKAEPWGISTLSPSASCLVKPWKPIHVPYELVVLRASGHRSACRTVSYVAHKPYSVCRDLISLSRTTVSPFRLKRKCFISSLADAAIRTLQSAPTPRSTQYLSETASTIFPAILICVTHKNARVFDLRPR